MSDTNKRFIDVVKIYNEMCTMFGVVESWSKENIHDYRIRPVVVGDSKKYGGLENIKRRNEKMAEEFLTYHIQNTLNVCDSNGETKNE